VVNTDHPTSSVSTLAQLLAVRNFVAKRFLDQGVNASFNNLAASFEVNIGGVRTTTSSCSQDSILLRSA